MMVYLTRGAVAMIMEGERKEKEDIKPVLQVFSVITTNYVRSNTVRYRLTLSDGSQLQDATIPTHMYGIVESGRLSRGSIIRLTEFAFTIIQKCKLIAVINLEIIAEKYDIIPTPGNSPFFSYSHADSPFLPRQIVNHRYYPQSHDRSQVMIDADAANVATGPKTHVDNAPNEPIDLNGSGSAPVGPSHSDQPGKAGGPSASDLTAGLIRLSSGVVPLVTNGSRPEMPILQIIDLFDSLYKNKRLFISDGSHMQIALVDPHARVFMKSPGKLQNGTIIRLLSYDFTTMAKQRTILLSKFEVLAYNYDIIGEPKLYSEAADDGYTTAYGSGSLGPRPSSLTANAPFQLHGIPATENLPSRSAECKFSKPNLPQQNQSCKESFTEVFMNPDLPAWFPPPPPQHDSRWRVEANVLKDRLFHLDLEMKREMDNHQAEVARLKANMDWQHEDYQNQINTLGKELEAAKKKADAVPKARVAAVPYSCYNLF